MDESCNHWHRYWYIGDGKNIRENSLSTRPSELLAAKGWRQHDLLYIRPPYSFCFDLHQLSANILWNDFSPPQNPSSLVPGGSRWNMNSQANQRLSVFSATCWSINAERTDGHKWKWLIHNNISWMAHLEHSASRAEYLLKVVQLHRSVRTNRLLLYLHIHMFVPAVDICVCVCTSVCASI